MGTTIDVRCVAERDIDEPLSRQIIALQRVAFPNEEQFKGKRWAFTVPLAEDRWFQAWEGDELAGSVWLHHRTILTADGPRKVGGIANVCSSPAHRGAGAAKACMRAAGDYMAGNDGIDFGLLFCGHVVVKFYASLGWHVTDNRYLAHQPDGTIKPIHDGCFVMNLDVHEGRTPWPTGEIDLNGAEW